MFQYKTMNILLDYLPILALLAGGGIAFIFDRLAVLRRPSKDRGDYWVFVIQYFTFILPFLLVSAWTQTLIKPVWESGYHLHLDLLPTAFDLSIEIRYYLALAFPFALWVLLLIIGIIKKPSPKEKARWLAGAIHFDNSRSWVILYFVLPLLILLLLSTLTFFNLGGGEGSYSAATWSTMAVFAISLIGIAFSRGTYESLTTRQQIILRKVQKLVQLKPWPEAVTAQGITLQQDLAVWEKSPPMRAVRGQSTENLVSRLHLMGAQQVAPELIEAIAILLNPKREEDIHRLILAPDECGQTEIIALAAKILEQRYHTTTLVITVAKAEVMAQRLQRWIAGAGKVFALKQSIDIPLDAMIWVVDAEILSDRLLPMMKNTKIVERIGFVVWWHLENYTGVLGANLWAISRRLDRLIQFQGRHNVRTLALVRNTPYSDDQIAAFLSRLLPHNFATEAYVQVPQRFSRETHLHILKSHLDFFKQPENRNIAERNRHLLLTTSKASVTENWPTYLEMPEDMSAPELDAFLQLPVNNSVLKEELYQALDKTDIRLMPLHSADVLAIVEMLSQTGRASETSEVYHVALFLPDNPYVRYLISTLSSRHEDSAPLGFGISRRLLGAEPHSAVIRRHLILALNELEDTRSGLLKNFLWAEEIIYKTLDEIYKENQLVQEEVRYLNDRERLIIEPKYKSKKLPEGSDKGQPLNTVNIADKLIDVRDPTKRGEIQMRVDPERLTIQAYPFRIFVHKGRRYQIGNWNHEEVLERKYIECNEYDKYSKSWRIRSIYVHDIKSLPNETAIDICKTGKKPLVGLRVNLKYEEVISGAIWQQTNLTTYQVSEHTTHLAESIYVEFTTRALVLGFTEIQEAMTLKSLCQALRHVLPVHLGVEEDALEIVPVATDTDSMDIFGIAIVDLYPEGIGLVDAIRNDRDFILTLLKWTKEWLENCPCHNDEGCEQCLRTVSARAAAGEEQYQLPTRSSALEILEKVV